MRRSLVLAAVLAIVGVGLSWFVVAFSVATLDSTSMEPWASPGDLLVHRNQPASAIAAGDVVTVRVPDRGLVTHRVVSAEDDGDRRFAVLMGDASTLPDPVPVTLPTEVDRVVLVVPRLGEVLRTGGTWLLGATLLLLTGVLFIGLAARREPPAPTAEPVPDARPVPDVDPRIEALLATCEQLEEDGLEPPVLRDIVRVRTAAIIGLPSAERSGAVLSADDGARFYVIAVADADPAMLRLVPVASERRRDGSAALDAWWEAVTPDMPSSVADAVAPWIDAA